MSYILDALQRSQQERELGQVPTLGSTRHTEGARPNAHPTPWILASVTLGIVALALALYAALSQNSTSIHPASAPATRSMTPAAPPRSAPLPLPASAGLPAPGSQTRDPAESSRPAAGPSSARQPVPPPAVAPAPHRVGARATADPPSARPAQTPAADIKAEPEPRKPKQVNPVQAGSALPNKLLVDIQSFKQRIERENKSRREKSIPAPPSGSEPGPASLLTRSGSETGMPRAEPAPPRQHALPSQVQQAIPAHRISVHVYAEDPADRFIILNSRRMGEGETNQDGLRVESIRPRGVVLSHKGTQFMHAR